MVHNPLHFSPRHLRAVALGVGVSFMLALAYVLVGVELQGNAQFAVVDTYAFTIAALLSVLLVVGYWFRYNDVSETVAFALVVAWGLASGVVDVFVYLLRGERIPDVLPWLDGSHVGEAAGILGFEVVTRDALLAVVAVTGVVVAVLVYILYRVEA